MPSFARASRPPLGELHHAAQRDDRHVARLRDHVGLAERDRVGLVGHVASTSSYIALCSKKMTGSSSRIAWIISPLAS